MKLKLTMYLIVPTLFILSLFQADIVRGEAGSGDSQHTARPKAKRKRLTYEERYKHIKPNPKALEDNKSNLEQLAWLVEEYRQGRASYKDAFFAIQIMITYYEVGGDMAKSDDLADMAEEMQEKYPELKDQARWPHSLSPEANAKIEGKFYPDAAAGRKRHQDYLDHIAKLERSYVDNAVIDRTCHEDTCAEVYGYKINFVDRKGKIKKTINFNRSIQDIAKSENGKFLAVHLYLDGAGRPDQIKDPINLTDFVGVLDVEGNVVWQIKKEELNVVEVRNGDLKPVEKSSNHEFNCFQYVSNDGKIVGSNRACNTDAPIIDPIIIIHPNLLYLFRNKYDLQLSVNGTHILSSDETTRSKSMYKLAAGLELLWDYKPGENEVLGCILSDSASYIYCVRRDLKTLAAKSCLLLDKFGHVLWEKGDIPEGLFEFSKNEKKIIFSDTATQQKSYINTITGVRE